MNKKQRFLTAAALVLFWMSSFNAPWQLSDGAGHADTVRYAPIFDAPSGGSWQTREISPSVLYTWGFIVVTYVMLLALLANGRRTDGATPASKERRNSNEAFVSPETLPWLTRSASTRAGSNYRRNAGE